MDPHIECGSGPTALLLVLVYDLWVNTDGNRQGGHKPMTDCQVTQQVCYRMSWVGILLYNEINDRYFLKLHNLLRFFNTSQNLGRSSILVKSDPNLFVYLNQVLVSVYIDRRKKLCFCVGGNITMSFL